MIYGAVIEENNELVIVAGDSVDEQQNFLTTVQDDNPALMQDTDFSRFLMDSNFSGFKITPTIMEFPSLNDLHEFIGGHDLKIIPLSSGRVQQERMLLNEEFNTKDQRTIAEINGITDEYDPWSNRTEEQKAQAAANKKKMQDKRKAGEVTGDSYGGGKKEEGIRVNDVQITIGEDGAVEIGQVLASKGEGHWAIQHYKVIIRDGDVAAYTDLIKQAGLMNEHDYPCEWERDAVEGIIIHTTKAGGERIRHAIEGIDCTMTEIEGDAPVVVSDDWKIADDDLVAVYFRVDIANAKAEDIESVLQAADSRPYIRRNVEGFGCWLAYIRERHAATAIEALSQAGFSASLAEVDRRGFGRCPDRHRGGSDRTPDAVERRGSGVCRARRQGEAQEPSGQVAPLYGSRLWRSPYAPHPHHADELLQGDGPYLGRRDAYRTSSRRWYREVRGGAGYVPVPFARS
jgi:hypothetical protein